MPKLRLVGYVRVSRVSGREGESFLSPTQQRDKIAKHADLRGHDVVEWIEDLDQPGSRYERPGLQRALEMVERGEADGIGVAKLDRFARSVTDGGTALKRLRDAGGSLVLVDESLDTSTSVGKAMFSIMLAFAELELERIGESWADARQRAIERGVHISNVPPIGYLRDPKTKKLVRDPKAARVVREVFLRRAAGETWTELCEFLDRKLPRPNGGRWSRGSVTSLVRRRTYLGEARAGNIVNRRAHEPIISRAEFEAAQSTTGRLPSTVNGALLAGIVRCEGCGHTLTRQSDGRRGYSNYGCRRRHSDGLCPEPVRISVARADTFVEEAFLARLRAEPPIVVEGQPKTDTLDEAIEQLESAEEELAAYRDANLVSVIGRESYLAGLVERQKSVDKASARVGSVPKIEQHQVFELVETWPELTLSERRTILAAVIESVVVRRAPRRGKGSAVAERLTINFRA